jgi:Domain of unknown function (DUF1844)
MAEKEKEDSLHVEDKRHFDREGNVMSGEASEPGRKEETPVESDAPPPSAEKIDFVTVLFSFVHTALIHLGDAPDPVSKTKSENLDGAREMIEILELLQEKTKGNLNQQEDQYLESALFDLRMRFVQKSKMIK